MTIGLTKYCSKCGDIQSYSTIGLLRRSIKGDWKCNKCSSSHSKKIYSDEVVNKIIELYKNGVSFSKISLMLKIGRDNVKNVLIEKNIWIENRDDIKKIFNTTDIDDIIIKYNQGLSIREISKLYNVSRSPITKILQDEKILREGKSDGRKIILSEEQEDVIKKLYLNDRKTPKEIGETLNLTVSFIDKYLGSVSYRRSRGEANSISMTGKKRSQQSIDNMRIAQQKLSESGKRKQTGGICKFYLINGLNCQGTYEKFYIEKLISESIVLPKNSESVITPFGVYYPDFSYDDRFIEIKSDYTYDVLVGKKICRFSEKIETKQLLKIKWVNENVKPIDILIIDKKNNKITKKLLSNL